MSRQAERLVAEIRAKRQWVLHELHELSSVRELERRVRRDPLPWILGATVLGLVAARFMAPFLLAHGRRTARAWVQARLGTALLAAGVAAATGRDPGRS